MPQKIGSNSASPVLPATPKAETPISAAPQATPTQPTAPGRDEFRVATATDRAERLIDGLARDNASLGRATRELFDALVDRRMDFYKTNDFKGTVDDAAGQELSILSEIERAAKGNPSGQLVVELKALEAQGGDGGRVKEGASAVRGALGDALAPVTIPYQLKDGPMSLPFTVKVDGREVRAELVGDVKGTTLSSARANVNGKSMYLTDSALTELLGRAGLSWSGEQSSQTEVMHNGFLGLGGVHHGVTYERSGFRTVTRDDVSSRVVYFHKGEIGLVPVE